LGSGSIHHSQKKEEGKKSVAEGNGKLNACVYDNIIGQWGGLEVH